jgi:hypothetical protein
MDSARSLSQTLPYQINEEEKTAHSSSLTHRRYVVCFAAAIILVTTGTVIWVLNLIGIIPGPWSSVFGAVFTGVGVIVALLNALLALTRTSRG